MSNPSADSTPSQPTISYHPSVSSQRSTNSISRHCVVSGGSGQEFRIVVKNRLFSSASTFHQFGDISATFVDKALAIEAFLCDVPTHHLILCLRCCGKSYTLSMIQSVEFFNYFCILLMWSCLGSFCRDCSHLKPTIHAQEI